MTGLPFTFYASLCFSSMVQHLSQVAPVESTSEGKPVVAVDVETSAKCLPFKNPNFVVRLF